MDHLDLHQRVFSKKIIMKERKDMKKISRKIRILAERTVAALKNTKGEGFLDTAVAVMISVIIGALLLGGLYTLFGDTILPTLTTKITDLFNYAG